MTEPITPTLDGALGEVLDLHAAGSFAQAVARCDELLSAYPDAVRVARARAGARESSGDFTQAIDDYTRVTEILPLDARALIGLARCQAAAGQSAAALITAQQALDIEPTNADALKIASVAPDALKNRGRIATPRAMYAAGLTTRALSQIRRFVQDNPDRVDAQLVLVEMMWREGNRIATAEQCQAILDAQPDCLNAHALLSALWSQMNNAALAQLHAREVERFDPDYREIFAWLGDGSPFAVRDAPLQPRQPVEPEPTLVTSGEQVTVEDADSEADRLAFVQELIAASGPVTSLASDAQPAQDKPAQPKTESEQYASDITPTSPLEWLPVDSSDAQEGQVPDWIVNLQKQVAKTEPDDGGDELGYAAPRAEPRGKRSSAAYEWSPGSGDEPQPIAPALRKADEPPIVATPVPTQAAPQPAQAALAQKSRSKLKPVSAKSSNDEKLVAARKAVAGGHYDEAADHYAALIRSGKKLDMVVADLDIASHAYPDVRRFHALLGDAYARKGDVNAALIAYHRALEIQ